MNTNFDAVGSPADIISPETQKRKTKRVVFICKGCGRESSVTASSMGRATWAGLCVPCTRKRFSRRRRGDETHPTGTIIHWDDRELDEQGEEKLAKVAITCHKCGRKSFQWFSWIKDERFGGLCHDCVDEQGNRDPRKKVHDEKLPSGSIIHWSERDKKNVPVFCALGGHRWAAPLASVKTLLSKFQRNNQSWPGYCPNHRRSTAALVALITKQPVKKPRGRQAGTILVDRVTTLRDIQSTVLGFKAEDIARSKVTAGRVAEALGIGGPGNCGDTMMRRVRRCGINLEWPVLRDFIWDGGNPLDIKSRI